MIFVTVGVQLPFDRLIRAMDRWARLNERSEVFAQIGRATYVPTDMDYVRNLNEGDFLRYCRDCDLVVSHAGMGSILTALELGKPIVVMARESSLGEHRNDHQIATSREMARRGIVTSVRSEEELHDYLGSYQHMSNSSDRRIDVSSNLIEEISRFISE